MRALSLEEIPQLVEDYPTPEPSPGEALICASAPPICSTDLELIKEYAPSARSATAVLGHEFIAVVEHAARPGALNILLDIAP